MVISIFLFVLVLIGAFVLGGVAVATYLNNKYWLKGKIDKFGDKVDEFGNRLP